MIRLIKVLWSYWQAKNIKFTSRESLEKYQTRKISIFLKEISKRSAYFKKYQSLPLNKWPVMDKNIMMANFDLMNTVGLKLEKAFEVALNAESSRDFKQTLSGITVGLSSGTSGQRGIFAASENETAKWAGIILSKTLPEGIFSGERVAFFLRANSNLYESVQSRWLTFRYFDLFDNFDLLIAQLSNFNPTIIVAPAQVLRALALKNENGGLNIAPKKVISVAEVLETQDRIIIEKHLAKVHQIYQATEGFLAYTCEYGMLHLNEEYVFIEPEWLDEAHERFVPIITDFSRMTQPIIRYRLNDIIIASHESCECKSPCRAIKEIEGRCDDLLQLPGVSSQTISVFADVMSRIIAKHLPLTADYRLMQLSDVSLQLHLNISAKETNAVIDSINHDLQQMGVDTSILQWNVSYEIPPNQLTDKRRRIMKAKGLVS
jgi:putative adenylate-forming enzyme